MPYMGRRRRRERVILNELPFTLLLCCSMTNSLTCRHRLGGRGVLVSEEERRGKGKQIYSVLSKKRGLKKKIQRKEKEALLQNIDFYIFRNPMVPKKP